MSDVTVGDTMDALAEARAISECQDRGLVFGWHPGLHHADGDPRRYYCMPQETGWWCRLAEDDGAVPESFPTLAGALSSLTGGLA